MMATRKHTLTLAASALLIAVGTSADAAVITPTSATSTSTIGGVRTIDKTIDASDLSAGGLSGDILSETHTNNDSNSGGYWLSTNTGGNVAGEVLTFTLEEATDISGIHMWGYERIGSTSRTMKTFDLSFSTDGGANYTTTIAKASLGNFAAPNDPIGVQTKTFATVSGVTTIKISNIENFGDANYVGLSEIRFEVVPEPGSLALLGLGGLLIARRRRG